MQLSDLKQKLADYPLHTLQNTKKVCEVCESHKADFYIEWEFPHYRDCFCLECALQADPEKEPELLLAKLRIAYKKHFKNGVSDQCFLLWIEGALNSGH